MLLGIAIASVCGFLLGLALTWKRRSAPPRVVDAQPPARLRAAIDAAPVAIIAATLDGRVTLWNRGAQRIFGWRRDEVEGHPLPFPPVDAEQEAGLRQRLAAGNEIRDQTVRRTDRDGEVRDLILNAIAERDAGGRITGYISVMEDVTDRRRAGALEQPPVTIPEAIAQPDSTKSADARFLSLISHDLRQPIQALSLVTGALERRASDPAMRELVEHLAAVVRSTQSTFEAIVEWSKLEGGQIVAMPAPFTVGDVMASLAELFAEDAERHGLALRCIRSSAEIRSDPAILRRILHHFLDNAMKFTPAGTVLLGARRHGRMLRVMVADSGIGIPPHQRAAVLAPFSQLDAGREAGGLGLGLANASRLAALMGAGIDYRSTPGKGSAFWIDVPLA